MTIWQIIMAANLAAQFGFGLYGWAVIRQRADGVIDHLDPRLRLVVQHGWMLCLIPAAEAVTLLAAGFWSPVSC